MPLINDPRVVDLKTYFSTERILMVPDYQREYTWGVGDREDDNQVVQLLTDLSDFVNSNATEYLLGLITLAKTDSQRGGLPVKHLVDGQQRTVTLSIFLMCAYEYLQKKSNNKRQDAEKTIFYGELLKLFSVIEANVPKWQRIAFSQQASNNVLQRIHSWSFSIIDDVEQKNKLLERNKDTAEEALDETMENLLDVREYLSEEIESQKWFGSDFLSALNKILDGVKFLELEINDTGEALGIYDRMNNRGLALSSADLIKNQLFVNVPSGPDYKKISTTWNEMSKLLKSHGPKKFQDPEFLVKSHAAVTWGTTVRENQLANKYREYFSVKGKVEKGIEKLEPVAFAERMKKIAQETINMCSESDPGNPYVFAARFLGAVQHFPLLIAADSIEDKKAKNYFLEQVGARALLQVFSKEHPPHVEGIYPRWAHEVAKVGKDVSIEELDSLYELHAFKKGDGDKVTKKQIEDYRNERIQAFGLQLDQWQYDSSSKRKIKAALALVSWYLDDELDGDNAFSIADYLKMKSPATKKTWEIDHVLANGYKNSKISDELRNNIGNLVLLDQKMNKQAQNSSPEAKADFYRVKSSLRFTQLTDDATHPVYAKGMKPILKSIGLAQLNWSLKKWNEESINNRRDFIKRILLDILNPK